MTSRELVKRTLEFDSPSRIPRDLWVLPWAMLNYPGQLEQIRRDFPNDFGSPTNHFPLVPPEVLSAYAPTGAAWSLGTFVDEWGCMFSVKQPGLWGEVKKPLVKDWAELDKVRIPEEYLTLNTETVNAYCRNTDLFCMAGIGPTELPRPFERLQFIRGTENVLVDLMEQPPELLELLGRMHAFFIKVMEQWANTDVDALNAMDDWGSQRSLLIPPDLWRTLFKPLYKDYVDIAHAHGKYFFFHSDGNITDILPDLIEIGVDAVNSQIFCMGVEELGRRFRGKITFWGEIDRQHILSDGSLADVSRAVQTVREHLYANGGVIAQCEFGAGANPQNIRQVFKEWDSALPNQNLAS